VIQTSLDTETEDRLRQALEERAAATV
jgi:uncharacterized membrane protein